MKYFMKTNEYNLVTDEVRQRLFLRYLKALLLGVGCVNVYCTGKSWQYLRWQLIKVMKKIKWCSVYSGGVVAHSPWNSLVPCFYVYLSYVITAIVCFVGKQSMQAHMSLLKELVGFFLSRKGTRCLLVLKMFRFSETSKKGEKCYCSTVICTRIQKDFSHFKNVEF